MATDEENYDENWNYIPEESQTPPPSENRNETGLFMCSRVEENSTKAKASQLPSPVENRDIFKKEIQEVCDKYMYDGTITFETTEELNKRLKPDDSFCDAECDCDMCINEYAEREQLKEEKPKLENPEPLPEFEYCVMRLDGFEAGIKEESVKAREKAIAKRLTHIRDMMMFTSLGQIAENRERVRELIEELQKVKNGYN